MEKLSINRSSFHLQSDTIIERESEFDGCNFILYRVNLRNRCGLRNNFTILTIYEEFSLILTFQIVAPNKLNRSSYLLVCKQLQTFHFHLDIFVLG